MNINIAVTNSYNQRYTRMFNLRLKDGHLVIENVLRCQLSVFLCWNKL